MRDCGLDRSGTPALLLHGWPDTGDLWREVTPQLTASGYRVLAPDLRGFGGSSKPTGQRTYAAGAHVGDVVALLDALGLPQVHLVGHDWGGVIGWMTAALAPDRVRTFTAVSTGHPGALRAAGWRQWARSWYALVFQVPGLAEGLLRAGDFRSLRTVAGHPDADSVAEQLRKPGALTASLGIYRASMRPRTFLGRPRALPHVTVPTLGVWSRHDPALTERQMTGSARYVTGPWRYERFEDCGHWIPLEAPQRLADLLRRFWSAH